MGRGVFMYPLFLLYPFSPSLQYLSPWCPPFQRYDVHQFPPRCLNCPKIIVNSMRISSIGTTTRPRQHVVKFSPGLPHNQTCGCWKGGNQSVIDVSLNASWVVSGFAFHTLIRKRWLRRFSIAASGDNQTFLEWGTYTQSNFSAASTVFFRYPIRATYFRLTVLEYVNHMINVSDGFPIRISALVSDSEPFGCECTSLETGECCPAANMEVKNNTCIMCMDPTDLHTVMLDGCGKCKPGTQSRGTSRRCVPVIPGNRDAINTLDVTTDSAISTFSGNDWRIQVTARYPESGLLVLFFTGRNDLLQSCTMPSSTSACFAALSRDVIPVVWDVDIHSPNSTMVQVSRQINPQYLQFDRGRIASHSIFSLALNDSSLRSWARCNGTNWCFGFLGALFITPLGSSFLVDIAQRPLIFEPNRLPVKSLICSLPSFAASERITAVEIHHLIDTGQFKLTLSAYHGRPLPNSSTVQWDDSNDRVVLGPDGVLEHPPPSKWSSMRVFAGGQQFLVRQPVPIVKKHAITSLYRGKESTQVTVAYGLALKPTPEPGDSEQLISISAVSMQPIRLTRLASVEHGLTTVYTTSKGFLSDSNHTLDLVVGCNGGMSIERMVVWLQEAMGLFDANFTSFVLTTCGRVLSGDVSKLYWLIPIRPMGIGRRNIVDIRVDVEFV